MQSAVNTRHWTLCLNWGSIRVCVRGTLLFTVIHPPHIRQMLLGKIPEKKAFCLFFPPFWSYIFSHGDVYQYLRELREMGLFFDALPEFVVSFKLAHLPNAVMWPCGLIGNEWSCELPINTSAHPSYAGLFSATWNRAELDCFCMYESF